MALSMLPKLQINIILKRYGYFIEFSLFPNAREFRILNVENVGLLQFLFHIER